MSVYKRGDMYWYHFVFAKQHIQEPAKTKSKTVAKDAEKRRRRDLEESYNGLADNRGERVKPVKVLAEAYLDGYKLRNPRAATFAQYAIEKIKCHLGGVMAVDVADTTVSGYQTARLKENAAPKTINEEVGFLLRILGDAGDIIRVRMKRQKTLKLKVSQSIGKAYASDQKASLLNAAMCGGVLPNGEKRTRLNPGTRSPFIRTAVAVALNTGMRDGEIRQITIGQVDLGKEILTVGLSKTPAGEGRTIPINSTLMAALREYFQWYTQRFGTALAEWYLFPCRVGKPEKGKKRPYDPTHPITTLKTSWKNVKKLASVTGRWHDTRHTAITDLAESGAGDQTIMDIAGHVSPQMLKRYSHIRMEAKRKAMEGIATKVPAAGDAADEPQAKTPRNSEAAATFPATLGLMN